MVDRAELIVVIINLTLGFVCAFPLARRFARLRHSRWGTTGSYVMLVFIYFVESIGFMAGMATNVPGILLAFVWGILLGYWIRRSGGELKQALGTAAFLSVYGSLPAVSLLSVPVLMSMGGWSVFSAGSGARFGVPTFVPWPLNTILGFCIAVALVAVVFKTIVTTGVVYFVNRSGNRARDIREVNHQTI
jgi:hypothetical protein